MWQEICGRDRFIKTKKFHTVKQNPLDTLASGGNRIFPSFLYSQTVDSCSCFVANIFKNFKISDAAHHRLQT